MNQSRPRGGGMRRIGRRGNPARRRLWLAVVALACAGVTALPASTAAPGTTSPTATGPLALEPGYPYCDALTSTGPIDPGKDCTWDYVLDPKSTNDPADSWHAGWGSPAPSLPPPSRGWCVTEATGILFWNHGRSTAAPAASYPPIGTSTVGPGVTARLVVDAAGHSTAPASLSEQVDWPPGTVTVVPAGGRLTVSWNGRTTRRFSATIGAEVENPGGGFGATESGLGFGVQAPCTDVPPPGPGFFARIVPSTVRPGQKAWLQLRIPGVYWGLDSEGPSGSATVSFPGGRLKFGLLIGGTSSGWDEAGTPPFTIKQIKGAAAIGLEPRPHCFSFGFCGRVATPGLYPVGVTLRGPTGTRLYRLSLRVRAS